MIDRLSPTDLPAAGAVLDTAFGRAGMTAALRLAYALQPESWFCLRRDGQILAVVGAHDYGRFAYIGMMGVHPSAQRQGLGLQVMGRLVDYLDGRGCPLLFLDASAAGQRLYPKLGFVPEGETLRLGRRQDVGPPASHERQGAAGQGRSAAMGDSAANREGAGWERGGAGPQAGDHGGWTGQAARITVSRLAGADLPAVAAFDAPIFGADRSAVLGSFWAGNPSGAAVARNEDRQITGYIMASGSHIGPWAATSAEAAGRLLLVTPSIRLDRPPFLTCPAANADALALLARHEFVVTERLLHMRRGSSADPRCAAQIYAQASLTLG